MEQKKPPAKSPKAAPREAGNAKGSGIHHQTVVVKIGSSSVIDESTGQVALTCLSQLVETLCNLENQKAGFRVVLVSSGAVGIGLLRMKMTTKPKTIQGKQAAAAVGQGRLMKVYDDLFNYFDQPVAQVLLSRGDLAQKSNFNNARNCLLELLNNRIIPILNENDTTSVEELKFGDNDSLSAMVAALLDASWLFLMTDVDALYDSNPNTNPEAKPIHVVEDIDSLAKDGCHCVVVHSRRPNDMKAIIDGARDVGTVFMPFVRPINQGKRFISHGCTVQGTIHVDAGAVRAVLGRNSLFPAGITKVEGSFDAQCGVNIVGPDGRQIARGLVNYCSSEIELIKGHKSSTIEEVLGYHGDECVIYRHNLAVTVEEHPPSPPSEQQ